MEFGIEAADVFFKALDRKQEDEDAVAPWQAVAEHFYSKGYEDAGGGKVMFVSRQGKDDE